MGVLRDATVDGEKAALDILRTQWKRLLHSSDVDVRALYKGVLTLAGALKDVHSVPQVAQAVNYDTVCLVTPQTVDVSTIKLLRRAFNHVIGVETIKHQSEKELILLGRPDLKAVLTKLHVFRLTQYSKVIFLDADVLPIRPLSHLFALPYEFSAVPDVGWPDIFNSGVLVLSPGQDKFNELTELLRTKGSWDGGDQGLLNEWRGGNWNRLSFTYNTTPTAAYTYAPAYERFGDQISAIHFIGPDKPWHSIPWRAPGIITSSESQTTSPQPQNTTLQPQSIDPQSQPQSVESQPQFSPPALSEPRRAYAYDALVDRWFEVYDRYYRSQPVAPDPQFEVQRYVSAWDDTQTSADDAGGHGLGLDDLRRIALEGMSSASFVPGTVSGEGDYTSMPLEGRVDLMPPEKDSTPELVPTETKQTSAPSATQVVQRTAELLSETEGRSSPRLGEQPPSPRFHASPDRSPSTPDRPRMTTLPTPRPDEIPPAPYLAVLSLPSTPTPAPSGQSRHFHPGFELERQHQQGLRPRPSSPPLLSWNPSIEPPPNVAPPSSAFPTDTYFQNAWDQHGGEYVEDSSPEPPEALFQVPPFPVIPEQLLRQGHYRNVTGSSEDASPSPDRRKVKPLFPWESRPRHTPGRVFPDADEPPPGMFIPPSPGSPLASPERRRFRPYAAATPSPLAGMPTGFLNAWDTIPSTQKYASKFGRPPPPPLPLGPAFENDGGRRGLSKRWEEPADESSQDGDDEDEEGEEIEGAEISMAADRRSRSSSTSSVFVIKKGRREYRSRGVQTMEPERRSEGVQVTPQMLESQRNGTLEGRTQEAETGTSILKGFTAMDIAMGIPAVPVPELPTGSISPREYLYSRPLSPPRPSQEPLYPVTPPQQKPQMKVNPSLPSWVMDDIETSSVASPPSSLGPISPPDIRLSGSPQLRKAGRVFDPARGVDVFKRGSEEAWAKLLGTGVQDDGMVHHA